MNCSPGSNSVPLIESQVNLIDEVMQFDTRKLGTYDEFRVAVRAQEVKSESQITEQHGPGHHGMNLKEFIDGRHDYLIRKTNELLQSKVNK
ncbi:MAG: hypothetical protein R3C11_24450 [Planctomycetaceae bacterium]